MPASPSRVRLVADARLMGLLMVSVPVAWASLRPRTNVLAVTRSSSTSVRPRVAVAPNRSLPPRLRAIPAVRFWSVTVLPARAAMVAVASNNMLSAGGGRVAPVWGGGGGGGGGAGGGGGVWAPGGGGPGGGGGGGRPRGGVRGPPPPGGVPRRCWGPPPPGCWPPPRRGPPVPWPVPVPLPPAVIVPA